MNFKYNAPLILFVAAFAAVVVFSFKGGDGSMRYDDDKTATTVSLDQLQFSAMHAEPAPATLAGQAPAAAGASPALTQHHQATARDIAQVRVLDEVLASRNDNDPRLDTELKGLSPAGKALLRDRYAALNNEKRNERGTIVFLLGRELATADDVKFMGQVLGETPCLSLSDCGREEKGSVSPEERHWEGPNETTLAYPQLVGLKQLDAFLSAPERKGEIEPSVREIIAQAKRSPVRKVAALATEIAAKHGL